MGNGETCPPGAKSSGLREQSPSGCNLAPEGGFVLSTPSFSSALLGLGLGLCLSRVITEATTVTWSWLASLALIIACSVVGVGLVAFGKRRGLKLAPLAMLYAYVLYPRIEPTLAWSVAFVAVTALLIANFKSKRSFPVDSIVFVLSLALYVHTLAPTVLPSNSGEFQFVADVLGIAHPPGFPLYTMLGKLFTLIPVGDIAYRVNLMSAFFAALTLAVVSCTVRRVTGSALGGVVGALALGTSTTFWAQATTANVRSLTAFFAALMLFALVSYLVTRRHLCDSRESCRTHVIASEAKQSPTIKSRQWWGLLRRSATQKLPPVIASEAKQSPTSQAGDCFRRKPRAFAMTGWAVVSVPYGWRDASWKTRNDTPMMGEGLPTLGEGLPTEPAPSRSETSAIKEDPPSPNPSLRERGAYLILFALAFGLGITHHGSLVFLILPFMAFLLVTELENRSFTRARSALPPASCLLHLASCILHPASCLLKPLLAFLLSLSVLLYLPIRGILGAPFGPSDIATPAGFLNHVLARGFRGDMFYFATSGLLLERFKVLTNILDFQFGLGLLVAAAVGILIMLGKDWRLLLLCGGAIAVQAVIAITYRAPETVEYLIPTYVPVAILVGYMAGVLQRWRRFQALNAVLVSLILLLGILQLMDHYPSFAWLREDRSARQYAESVMSNAPSGSLVLANWHWATPLWYLQYSEGVRPDVEVKYVYPEGAEPISATWLRRIEESVGERPLIVTNYYQEFGATPYRFLPLGEAFLVQSLPPFDVPDNAARIDATFADKVRLLGYRLLEDGVSSGQPLYLDLYWQPLVELKGNYSFFVHLVGDSGQVLGQMDVTHDTVGFRVGEVIVDRYQIQILPTTPSGSCQLIAGVYITLPEGGWQRLATEEGAETVPLAEVEVVPPPLRPVTLHPLHQPFASGLTLIGVDYDTSLEGTRRVYLHWHRFRFDVSDYDVLLYADDNLMARSRLPPVPLGAYLTTAHDLPLTAMPWQVELRSADDVISQRLGPWGWPRGGRLALPTPPLRSHYVDLGGEMLLVGAEYRRLPGDRVRVELRLVAKKPLLRDYVVSVRLTDEAGRPLSQDDTVPALGAIPTLKWIRGSSISDVHFVPLLASAPAGSLRLSLVVYDAFTMRPLSVLDDRLAKLGPSVPLAPLELQ